MSMMHAPFLASISFLVAVCRRYKSDSPGTSAEAEAKPR
jgi:hypothetical protein